MKNLIFYELREFGINCIALHTFGGIIEALQLVILGIVGLKKDIWYEVM